MSPSQCFQMANNLALLGWIALLFVPHAKITLNWVRSGRLSLLLAVGYLLALGFSFPQLQHGSGFGSLAAVKTLFSNDWALLAGWIHYLAFDLVMGARALDESNSRSRWLMTLILILIFLFGPVGWLLAELTKGRTKDYSENPLSKRGV